MDFLLQEMEHIGGTKTLRHSYKVGNHSIILSTTHTILERNDRKKTTKTTERKSLHMSICSVVKKFKKRSDTTTITLKACPRKQTHAPASVSTRRIDAF
ncbi:hypothetical protein AG1IA_01402 [Rhizoctonia solani AG-1 IA]|uniref:Uncharacterized protein n=1 Tax=Thanatephorus cucumeris (strain AG1-IA) TaxID=983506 RepID=L8X650_THACA|nr:hypothetical protein AG1IA_01402 [Rhizoctonia solani AG-1 IA]